MIMDRKYPEFSDYINSGRIDEQTLLPPNSEQYSNAENGDKFDLIPSPDINFINYPFEPPDPNPDSFNLPITLSPGTESFVISSILNPDEGSFPSSGWSTDGVSLPSSGWSPDGVSFPSSSWSPDEGSFPSSGWNPEEHVSSPSEDSDSTDPVFKFISQMLLEETTGDKPPILDDPLALKATEKSLYDVIGEEYPYSLNSPRPYVSNESPDAYLSISGSDYGGNASTSSGTSMSTGTSTAPGTIDAVDHQWIGDGGELNSSLSQSSFPSDYNFHSNLQPRSQFTVSTSNGLHGVGDGLMGSLVSEMVQNIFSDNESVLQFKRGMEEASKFLPSASKLVIDLESNNFSTEQTEAAPILEVKQEKFEGETMTKGSRGRKNHERGDSNLEEGRSSKQSAGYVEEGELSELFDKVMLWSGGNLCGDNGIENYGSSNTLQPDEQSNKSNSGKTRGKKQGKKKETVDLRTLLILCAQAVSTNDIRTASELLKQVRQHSSSTGDGSQRLAHVFANGLEARMAGNRVLDFYNFSNTKRLKTADILKAYKANLYSCPFKKLAILFSNKMIYKAAEKASTLHVVDFGVKYGFQWPILIQKLGMRPGGPPKLRITAIEMPQPGFRPEERIVETGHRLENYCERFHVPFEYIPIAAQNWEKIPIEDLKINSNGNELLAVNCLYRFQHLLDETVEVDCPRNAVLDLIRKINPNIFVHTIVNGSYNAPFFVTRFREALFHFSSVFDMFDCTLPRDSQERMMLEGEFYGRGAVNAVACEGTERIERPETYKQWQVRTTRAGFKQLPLDQEVVKLCRDKMKTWYHKDFVMDEDNNWMLQGWKGRINYASACWVPA